MKRISIEVSDKTAEVIKRMSKEELDKFKEKVESYASDPANELLSVMEKSSEYAKKNGLSPEKLADILDINIDEMNRTLGRL